MGMILVGNTMESCYTGKEERGAGKLASEV